jgi:hypothetical protein
VLTNADIVQMQRAGLSVAIILSKIGTSTTRFTTGEQQLTKHKQGEQKKHDNAPAKKPLAGTA